MLFKPLFWLVLKLIGWKPVGKIPKGLNKYIMVVAPHTSNYDFPIGVLVRPFLRASYCGFLIKDDYMKPPFGFLFRWLGGIPVNRSKRKTGPSLVEQVAATFAEREKVAVAITPEGTRSLNPKWRSGFYHIAQAAQVPIVLSFIDYHRKEAGCGEVFYPTGDYEADLAKIQAFYKTIIPKKLENSHLEHVPQPRESRLKHYSKLAIRWIVFLVALFLLWNARSAIYGLQQGWGQAKVIFQARPIADYLNDPSYPDSLKAQIRLIQDIREYAFDSIGLDPINSYTRMYDQKGKPLLWAVTACERFALKPHRWCFPIAGCFPYKGYFDQEKAKAEANSFDPQKFDTGIREVSAWSTLGWLSDPILSTMLQREPGRLANLVIHELTHGTLFIKDGIAYNENLASFVGDQGAIRFLKHHFGENAAQLQDYLHHKEDRERYVAYVLSSADQLDSLYSNIKHLDDDQKQEQKQQFIQKFKQKLKMIPFRNPAYTTFLENREINNTFFMSYIRYQKQQNEFRREFEEEFGGDFPAYIKYLKEKYPSILY